MINTVLGAINPDKLGVTLMHEHIIWDWEGADKDRASLYTVHEVSSTMEQYLLELKKLGCQTLVEGTTYGAGRDVNVLKACAEKAGINIITNCGMWDGGKYRGKFVPKILQSASIDEVVDMWYKEYMDGIECTGIKPGFIKLALGDEAFVSELQEKMLRAATRVSKLTQLPIECHIGSSVSAVRAVEIIEEEELPYNKFAWIHIDWSNDYPTVLKLAQKGIWVEIDAISAFHEPYEVQVDLLEKLIKDNLLDQVLISQDAGCYEVGEVRDTKLRSYNNIFTKFIPICKNKCITEAQFKNVLVDNPARFLG